MHLIEKLQDSYALTQKMGDLSIRFQNSKNQLNRIEIGNDIVVMSKKQFEEIVQTLKEVEEIKVELQTTLQKLSIYD